MGWRAWDAYEREWEAQRRAKPWRERYSWRGVAIFALIVALAIMIAWANIARAESQLADTQVIANIKESRNAYYATGHPCACPYDRARNGSSCGGRSAYSRPGGAEQKCLVVSLSASFLAVGGIP